MRPFTITNDQSISSTATCKKRFVKMPSFIKLITILAGCFVPLLSGCEQQNPNESLMRQSQSKKQEVPSGVLRIPLNGGVGIIDPGLASVDNQSELVEQLFLGLTDFDKDSGKVVGELATDWQISENGTVYTFNLRRNVKWTDGKPVTAHDIVWAIRRNFSESQSPPFAILKNIQAIEEALQQIEENALVSLGVRAIDQNTVEFTLEQALDDTMAHQFREFVKQEVFQKLRVSEEKNTNTQQMVPTLTTDNWQTSKDGTVYTLKLPLDLKFVQGEESGLAHQMVEAVRYIFNNQASPFDNLKNAGRIPEMIWVSTNEAKIQFLKSGDIRLTMADSPTEKIISLGVRAIDDYTVQFTLEHPNASFPALVSTEAFRPLPRHIIEQYGDEWTLPQNIQTNGSYKLAKWDKGNQIVLTKNPDYYEADKVNIRKVQYDIVPENSIGFTMYENDALDIIGGAVYLRLPQTELPRIQTDPKLDKQMHTGNQACTEWYEFNTQKSPTDNVLVRKAIAAAIDKQLLIEIVMKGSHIPAMNLIHPTSFVAINSNEAVGIPFNPEQAKEWLKEAGYPNGQGFPKLILVHNTSETHHKMAQGIKTLLKHYLNIKIDVRELNWNHYNATIKPLQPMNENSPHLFRFSMCVKYSAAINWLGPFHSSAGLNWLSGKNSELFDNTVDKARFAVDQVKSEELSRRAEQILIEEEVAMIPLYFRNARFLVKPRVKGWYNRAFGGQHIRNWSLEN
jgi:oligopeptide transport system substrate-binding protein